MYIIRIEKKYQSKLLLSKEQKYNLKKLKVSYSYEHI